ncbi:hypothetical protein C5142_01545 [Rhodococcus sp. BGS-1C]|uniref:biotin synthase auxiliary protein BsaP n=1 Tax=Nocardiaceae TaxID=85025 RepID=UPI00096AB256|nr:MULTISPECIES: hypothetical protein [Rhodococcus]MCC8927711.1 hypothetical protein [Rhodococcus sp. I2R]MCZ4275518.1 hypothetical protein [Rhodococcus yunnanensis]
MTSDERYNPYTGRPVQPGDGDRLPRAVMLGLEPPRFCADCGRRRVVQVLPHGWSSTCSRHGAIDSAAFGER